MIINKQHTNEKQVKQSYQIFLSAAQEQRLRTKASAAGFEGRGMMSRFIQKIADEEIIFMDLNAKKLLEMFGRDNGNTKHL